jgi:hypothetical protein
MNFRLKETSPCRTLVIRDEEDMSDKLLLKREDAVRALRHLEIIVPSLDQLGSASASMTREEYERATAAFIDDWDVTRRLSEVRRVLSAQFPEDPGPDGMDDLERELQDVVHWTPSSRMPPAGL